MAYDEPLASRIREVLAGRPGMTEMKMFGGIAFMDRGNMACGVVGSELMVRVGPEAHDAALAQPGTRPMDFNGRAMKGMLFVGGAGLSADGGLQGWLERGLAFTQTLPNKASGTAKPRAAKKFG